MTDPKENRDFEVLLDYIKQSRGFDFTGYKRSSLMRRVSKRMQTVNIDTYNNYLDYLEVHPEEFIHLFNTLLINVTSFFRDRSAWEYLASEIVPRIAARQEPKKIIRVWAAGCASGQEVYTIAMTIAQAIGIEKLRERVKIYATDVDDEALNQARQGSYLSRELSGLTPEEVKLFFEKYDNHYVFRKDLRRCVIFGRHDLIQDAPISKIDLLVCRNTLMYFNAETQSKILARFHFALQGDGFLFLGKGEMLLTHANKFTPVDLKRRIFTKVSNLNLRDQLASMAQIDKEEAANHLSTHLRLREAAFDRSPLGRIIVDANGLLTMANERARVLFNLTTRDVGRLFQDLEISYRPIELRSCIEQAYTERRVVNITDVMWQLAEGETIYLDVQVAPLLDTDNNILGVSINFIEVTHYQRLQQELQHSNQELEMAYEELQSTNEELETTNEELQSTNEELETMNEELQSTNKELQTVNEELQLRSEELNQSNAFLESILASLKGAVVVVNRDLHIQIWNYKAEDFWGLRKEEALGQHFLNLDIGLPVKQLRQPIRLCLLGKPSDSFEVVIEAINRRGRSIQCRVTCTPLIGLQGQIQGAILLMEAVKK